MFKVGRWKNEKIKVVFKLNFQATQVPMSKARLMISLIPVDVGQPTVRLGKAAVQNGICTWENPVYEAVKFTRETKTGKIQDKYYQFIISTGSSKSGFSGEVLVNVADYVEAAAPSTISLPIKSSYPGAILHVTIQNTQKADDQSILRGLQDIEENNAKMMLSPEVTIQSRISNSNFDEGRSNHNTQDGYYTMVSPEAEANENSGNPSTLNSLFKQKESMDYEETQGDQSAYRKSPTRQALTRVEKERQTGEVTDLDWSSEDEVFNFIEDTRGNIPRNQEQEPPRTLVEQLEREIFALKRQANVTDIELQSLRRQVVKETKRGQELSGQVVKLKQERDAMEKESEKPRSQQKIGNVIEHPRDVGGENKKFRNRINDVEDLTQAKDLIRVIRSQLRKTQDSNSELILKVRGLEEKLGKKERELQISSRKLLSNRRGEEHRDSNSQNELESDEEIQELATKGNLKVSTLQEQIKNLQDELENHVKEKRQLKEQIEQFSQDYEMAKKENSDLSSKFNQKQLDLIKKERECTHNLRKVEELESQIERMENVIKKQGEDFSENSATVNDLEAQVNSLKDELERQATEFEDELSAMTSDKIEQEKRALQAEENLRRTKRENAITAQRLQEEFRELSEELTSKFKEHEELTTKAEAEARELRDHMTILEEHLQKATQELELVHDQYATEIEKISSQLQEKEKQFQQLSLIKRNETEEHLRSHKKVEDRCEALSNENQVLRMEVERLTEENYYFTKQLEEMKALLDETKMTLGEIKKDRDEIDTKYSSAISEIEQNQKDLKALQLLKEKVEAMAGVQSQMENLQVQHSESKSLLSNIRLENKNLKKQVSRQRENLQKKDHEIANLEKFKDTSSKEISALKERMKQLKAVRPAAMSSENGSKVEEKKYAGKKTQQLGSSGKSQQNASSKTSPDSKRETSTEKKVIDSQTSDLLSEVAQMKEKNTSLEVELRELQDKYSDISLKFAEVEGERQQLVMTIRNLRNGQKK